MHRFRSWTLDPPEWRTQRNRSLPIEGGDGSTLSLDFTTGVLDPRLTFTRTTNATFVNSQGYVEWAGANLMTQSNAFTTSPWSSTNVTMTTDGESPVGSAWRMTENSAAAVLHRLDPAVITCADGVISVSAYIKQGSGTRQAYFLVSDNSTGEVRSKRLNPVSGLLEGSESVGGSWTAATTSVVNVGNGWYRLVLTATKNAGSGVITRIGMSDSSGNFGYNGDGTSYLMLSGVQINPGSVQSYISTSGSAYQAPRFDYDPTTLTPRGLLIEGQATNLLKYSNPIATTGSHWGLGGYTIGTGATSPDGTSTSSRFTVNLNSGATCSMQQSVTMNATSCTFSVWFKNGTLTGSSNSALTSIAIRNATTATILLRFYFNATNPSSITYVTGSTGASVVAYPNGWYRISATVTSGITSGNSITGYFAGLGGSVNDELNNYADWWGPQIEEGSGASSYIPTAASTVTRTADDCLLDNIATAFGFNASEGTILIRYGNRKSTGSNRSYTFLPASGTNNQIFEGSGTAFNVYSSGSFVAQIGTTNISGARLCAAYKLDDYAVSVNGGAVATDTSGAVPSSLTRLSIGGSIVNAAANNYGPISLFKYWPTRLPNAQLQSLTT